jgi:SAM-dependent methyltransferase
MQEIVYHTNYQHENSYWWFLARNEILKQTVESFCDLNNSFNLLDVGCGTGGFASSLLNQCNVIGIDTSDTALEYSRKRGIKNLHNCLLKDFDKSKYGKIDAITILDVIEHIQDDKQVVEEAYNLLDVGSYIIASVPAYQWLWSKHDEVHMHYRRYNKKNFQNLFKDAGFKIIYSSYFNSILFFPAVIKRSIDKFTNNERKSDSPIDEVPEAVNTLFTKIFRFEKSWVPKITIPFGLSIVVVAKKI